MDKTKAHLDTTNVLIIGCGIAGATAALRLAENPDCKILVITRDPDPHESNSQYAQGGIIGRGHDDNADLLVNDILAAGAGASSPKAARILAEEGPALLQEILVNKAGVKFDSEPDGEPEYGREAAHSRRRVLHVGDGTGRAIVEGLIATMKRCPNITILPNMTAVDLITFPHHSRDPLLTYGPLVCHGAFAFDRKARTVHRYLADMTILATGGIGRIYRNTSNPFGARGDGLAMAHRAGARIVNAEYVQFHPTTLVAPGADGFLISEAVRGEGGILLTPDGRAFMADYSPQWKDLAPRDVVARAIHHQMETHGYSYVLLDIATHMEADAIRERFPNIYATCLKAGIDITREPIPVVPAAHYFCGGVLVDEWGRTNIENLYAVGEISCTGLHGANRLASTSLLEGLVWGDRSARDITRKLKECSEDLHTAREEVPQWDESGLFEDADSALIQGDMQTIQNIMWHYVGLARNEERLSRAIRELRHLWNEIETFYRTTKLSDGLIGLRNAVEVALIIAQAALHNRHSRGCHYREDSAEAEGERLI
ncbi:L-aspartate oxidase [Leptolinea tardivitalis]|uniref:L-aspartate oxidase n=1 Tax=Leptolinea tardivitalis TaxID=229920 RepID=A0A0P6XU38_9CHLR|nr:L-aspartate oxidase [Leptolinea tardivitalis]KPL72944.1 L-aspartate oxidase [Leptolinea tardivitalis]GAP20660.1 L-aspartate oxidase [Leptolinea tardivitalis]